MSDLIFITGNQHKADQYSRLLGLSLEHRKADLDEIQSASFEDVARDKVEKAFEVVRRPVFIDDFGLCIDELNGLPGPFTKFFVRPNGGLEKLCKITDSLNSRKARVISVIAYRDAGGTKVFRREMCGNISREPRGTLGIDTDKIFEPDGYGGKTRAELSRKEYDDVYMKVRPISEFRAFLQR